MLVIVLLNSPLEKLNACMGALALIRSLIDHHLQSI